MDKQKPPASLPEHKQQTPIRGSYSPFRANRFLGVTFSFVLAGSAVALQLWTLYSYHYLDGDRKKPNANGENSETIPTNSSSDSIQTGDESK
jgi:hypothetical protein